jgi:hypothetical protein
MPEAEAVVVQIAEAGAAHLGCPPTGVVPVPIVPTLEPPLPREAQRFTLDWSDRRYGTGRVRFQLCQGLIELDL